MNHLYRGDQDTEDTLGVHSYHFAGTNMLFNVQPAVSPLCMRSSYVCLMCAPHSVKMGGSACYACSSHGGRHVLSKKHPSRDVIFSGQNLAQQKPKFVTSRDVLEPSKQALLASHDVIVSGQICSSKLQRVSHCHLCVCKMTLRLGVRGCWQCFAGLAD